MIARRKRSKFQTPQVHSLVLRNIEKIAYKLSGLTRGLAGRRHAAHKAFKLHCQIPKHS